MVFRFPIQWVCIIIGLCFVCGSFLIENNDDAKQIAINNAVIDRPLIIDAGHGGTDGGAVGVDGIAESHINLHIALKLNALAQLFGVPTIMTRYTEELDYPAEAESISEKKTADQNARLRLIQDYPHGILYSIHQNSYPSKKVSGIQVLYGHTEESRYIGNLLQNNLNEAMGPSSRRVASEIANDIYLLRKCENTAALIECGFISNPTECSLLQTEDYQKKLAAVMLAAYLQFLTS